MNPKELRVPSVSDYVAAFRTIEPRVTDNQRELLRLHHDAPARVTSATRLATDVDFESYKAVNLQYGLLAQELLRALNVDLGNFVGLGILVEFVDPGFAANEHYLWVLRPNVVRALEEIGWARRDSDLLYPESAYTPAVETT